MAAAEWLELMERDRLRLTDDRFAGTGIEGEAAITRENDPWMTKRSRCHRARRVAGQLPSPAAAPHR